MRIRVTQEYDWPIPETRAVKVIPVGERTVTREQGELGIRLGRAVEIKREAKDDAE